MHRQPRQPDEYWNVGGQVTGQGDPADAAPLPAPPDLDLANPSVTVVMGSPVEVEAQGSTLDFFHCLSFDPGNDQDVYVDGLQVVQGNSSILHHVLMYLDTSAESAPAVSVG